MLTVKEALNKADAMVRGEEVSSNPFAVVEVIGYVKAIREIYHNELSDDGSLYYVNNIIKDLLLLATVLIVKNTEEDGTKHEK